jgi:hypothetical protein
LDRPDEHITESELVKAVEQLSPEALERFADEVASIRARTRAHVLTANESALFGVINRGLSDDERSRLETLADRRRAEALTPDEHRELIDLQERLERLHAARMEALASLASLRSTTLTVLMDELGIRLPDHA